MRDWLLRRWRRGWLRLPRLLSFLFLGSPRCLDLFLKLGLLRGSFCCFVHGSFAFCCRAESCLAEGGLALRCLTEGCLVKCCCFLFSGSLLLCLLQRGLTHGSLFRFMLRGELSGSLRCPLCLPVLFFQPTGFRCTLHINRSLGLRLLLQTGLFLFNCLLNSLTCFLARLRACFRKIAVFCAVQIGPRIQCCHIFGCVVLVVQRPSISHLSPQNFPCCNFRAALGQKCFRRLLRCGRRSRSQSKKRKKSLPGILIGARSRNNSTCTVGTLTLSCHAIATKPLILFVIWPLRNRI